ncbi:DNA-directed DNA polymerase alpha catalytic subunit pol1 [Sorochytrium milnesiophthora]
MKVCSYIAAVALLAAYAPVATDAQAVMNARAQDPLARGSRLDVPLPIARKFESEFRRMGSSLSSLVDWAEKSSGLHVKDLPEEYIYFIDVPGLRKADIQVTLEGTQYVAIKGSKECPQNERHCVDRTISHEFKLKDDINPEHISVNLENGVLRIHVPKANPPKRSFPISIVDALLGRDATPKDNAESIAIDHEGTLSAEAKERLDNPERYSSYEDTQDMLDQAAESANAAGTNIYQRAKGAAGNVADAVTDAKRKVNQGYENVKDTIHDAEDKVTGAYEAVQHSAHRAAEKIHKATKSNTQRAIDVVDETQQDAKDRANIAVENAKANARDVKDSIKNQANQAQNAAAQKVDQAKDQANNAANYVANKASDAYDYTADKAAQAAEAVRLTGRDAYEATKEQAQVAADKAAQKASEATDTVKEQAKVVADKTAQKAGEAYDATKQKAAEAYDTTSDYASKKAEEAKVQAKVAADKAANKASDAAEVIKEKASEAYDATKQKAAEVKDAAADTIAEQVAGVKKAAERAAQGAKVGYQEGKVEEKVREAKKTAGGWWGRADFPKIHPTTDSDSVSNDSKVTTTTITDEPAQQTVTAVNQSPLHRQRHRHPDAASLLRSTPSPRPRANSMTPTDIQRLHVRLVTSDQPPRRLHGDASTVAAPLSARHPSTSAAEARQSLGDMTDADATALLAAVAAQPPRLAWLPQTRPARTQVSLPPTLRQIFEELGDVSPRRKGLGN